MGQEAAFWILSIIGVIGALMVVMLNNVFRAALSLIVCFVTVAGIYITLSADFLAAIQVLVYIGAIAVLIIIAVMLTRDYQRGSPTNKLHIPAALIAIMVFGVIGFAVIDTPWQISTALPLEPTTPGLAASILGEGGFILAVEISAVLLIAAVIGAIALVREK